jgi:hypothetical protein
MIVVHMAQNHEVEIVAGSLDVAKNSLKIVLSTYRGCAAEPTWSTIESPKAA